MNGKDVRLYVIDCMLLPCDRHYLAHQAMEESAMRDNIIECDLQAQVKVLEEKAKRYGKVDKLKT